MDARKDSFSRYARVKKILEPAISAVCSYMHFEPAERVRLSGPTLIVSNHNTDLDPIFLNRAFRNMIYMVASEHAFRRGFRSAVLSYLFGPIPKAKGGADPKAVMSILRELRKGRNVCIFAEGNRSFNGLTGPVFPATAKLAAASKAALATYRMEGGYLTSPRWSHTLRRGRIFGRLVHLYTPEELKSMTEQEINDAIEKDLREDAFASQRKRMIPYPGKRLAEGLEYALYLCPKCGGRGTLVSHGDRFECKNCGCGATYNRFGFFEGEAAPFETVADWDRWQETAMERLVREKTAGADEPVFSDRDCVLKCLSQDHKEEIVAAGRLAVGKEWLSVGERRFPLKELTELQMIGRWRFVFFHGGKQYEVGGKNPFCGRKYSTYLRKRKELET